MQWQPIETAPIPSGLVILAYENRFGSKSVACGHYYVLNKKWVYDCHEIGGSFPQPTYWMPLPKPPEELQLKYKNL